MKIIACDNLDREGPGHNERDIVSICDPERAHQICTLLNEDLNKNIGTRVYVFYKVVGDDYELYRFIA